MKIDKKLYEKLDRDELLRLNAYLANKMQFINHLFTLSFISMFFAFLFFGLYFQLKILFLILSFIAIFFYFLFLWAGDFLENKIKKEIENRYFRVEVKKDIKIKTKKNGN